MELLTTPSSLEGIVIRVFPSRDSDLVLKVVGKGLGKVSLLAKHARRSKKRFSSSFDLFDRGRFEIKKGRGSLLLVDSFTPSSSFKNVRSDLSKLVGASFICEVFDVLVKEEAEDSADLFDILNLCLDAVEESKELKETLRALYIATGSLLQICGFSSETSKTPSKKAFLRLIEIVEGVVERKLATKEALVELMTTLRR